ncbi:non-ribosomal peptide synthetase [Chitinimonas sp. JJ19]|uniref:non-ribosomal peptide synthetase n=1 Tax=Chitinimonas sp. JJ19 TaxID=3109352 RepID=UPI0030037444
MNNLTEPVVATQDGFALSPQQRNLWTLRSREDRPVHCHAIAGHLGRALDSTQLRHRLLAMLAEHEILRTRFARQAGLREPIQVPLAYSAEMLSLREEDWRHLDEATVAQMKALRWEEANGMMRVETGIAALAALLPDGRQYLILAVAPLAADARTLVQLLQLLGGAALPENVEPIQYADLSAWLEEVAQADESEAGRRFWRSQQAAPTGKGLVFDTAAKAEHTGLPQARRALPEALCLALARQAERWGLPVEDLYFGSWLWLLQTLSVDQALPAVSRILDGVSLPELAYSLGPLERALPFVLPEGCDLRTPASFLAVAHASAEMRAQQDCFVVEGGGDATHYAFRMLNLAGQVASLDALSVGRGACRAMGSVWLQQGYGCLMVEAGVDSYSQATVDCLVEQWCCLLAGLADTEADAELGLRLTPALQAQVLALGQGAVVPLEADANVVAWFESALAGTGHGAVMDDAHRSALVEIDARANRLARQLRQEGIGKGQLVGLYQRRSVGYVVAMLAVLKAGAAYMPLDRDYPSERLAYMLDNAGSSLVLVEGDTQPQLSGAYAGNARFVALAELERTAATQQDTPLGVAIAGEDLAYVLYTSGSTGTPKGVMIPHRALFNHMRWMIGRFDFSADDVFLQRTSSSFDASVWEFWAPLLVGGTMVIARQDNAYDLAYLMDLMAQREVTVAQFVPSLLDTLVDYPAFTALPALKQVFAGGEALTRRLRQKCFARLSASLCNLYGPTEACIDATYQLCSPDDGEAADIGSPIDNTQIIVVDAQGRLAGIGIAGELCIGGAGLFSGYLNRQDLTDEKCFMPDGLDQLFYRTGDLARLLPDGALRYLGRMDQQVKLHGQRIELTEIDAVLSTAPGVQRAITVVAEGAQLVALVQCQATTTQAQLLAHASQFLPAYMVPSRTLAIEQFPHLPNGKLDRAAMVKLAEAAEERTTLELPQTRLEQVLLQIWQQVLRRTEISVTDRFFAVGGDSIRSIQVVYEASQQGLALTVMDIFKFQTIRALASYLASGGVAKTAQHTIPAGDPVPNGLRQLYEDVYPATEMQRYMIARYAEDSARHGIFHAQQALRIHMPGLDIGALAEAIVAASDAPNFKTRFVAHGSACFQVQLPASGVMVVQRDLRALDAVAQGEAVQRWLEEDRQNGFDPFDLSAPLARAAIMQLAADQAEVVFSNHHAIQDGWGNVVFLNRVSRHYRDAVQGVETVALAPVNVCKEYALIQHALVQDPEQTAFWRQRMAGMSASYPITAAVAGPRYAAQTQAIDTGLVQAVNQLGQAHNLTAKAIFLTAYMQALQARGLNPVIGVVSNGRSEQLSDPFQAMGLYWNLMPFGTRLPEGEGVDRSIWVQAQLMGLEPYARFPLPCIEALGEPAQRIGASFNFVNFHNEDLGEGNAAITGTYALDNFGFPLGITLGVEPDGGVSCLLQLDRGLAFGLPDFFATYTQSLCNLTGHVLASLS